MKNEADKFKQQSEVIASDLKHRKVIQFNMNKYANAVKKGIGKYASLEAASLKAAATKRKVLNNLDEYLIRFEQNIINNGAKVIWAADKDDAQKSIAQIVQKHGAKLVVKSKSMTTEEIELNSCLENLDVDVVETDLGEFIVQQAGEKPYHIVTPAMHKSKEDVADLFEKKFDTPAGSSPVFLSNFVRNHLRNKFLKADIGITGANFLLAEPGAVVVTENEGNATLSFSMPKVHIAIAGIEKIIPDFDDLNTFLPLLAVRGTGQNITAYNSIVSGPRKSAETNGPDQMYVVLLDNGRSSLLAQEVQKEALACIRCGACLNACPVYRSIGGYTYNTTYTGPIGSVISPHFTGMKQFGHLSFASTLCGKCKDVCPVKIDIPRLLLHNRKASVESGYTAKTEKWLVRIVKFMLKNRWLVDIGSLRLKNALLQRFMSRLWGNKRVFPKLKKSFNKQYRLKFGNE